MAELAASGVNTEQLIRDPKTSGDATEGLRRADRLDSGEHIDDVWNEVRVNNTHRHTHRQTHRQTHTHTHRRR